MAATNYTPIQLYHSSTATAAPSAGNLANGELAINITDGKLYYKDSGGVVQVIATKGAGTIGGSTTQIQYNNAGALAGSAAMTFNSGTNTVTLTTLNLTNALGATYGGTAQSAYTQGDILYSSATNTLSKLGIGTVDYILTSTGSVPQWSAPSSISVLTATNLAGGSGGSVPYQSTTNSTTFLAIGAANRVMTSSGTAPQWVTSLTGLTGVSSSSITNTSLTSGRVVYSGASGVQTDSSNLTFNGTTLSAGGLSTVGITNLVKTVNIGDSNFSGVAVFAPATPAKLYIGTGTVTDTTSAIGATNAVGAVSSLAITPIAATNASVTYTNAATLYIAGAPSAGTNVTLTNPYSLYIAAGTSYFGGDVVYAGGLTLNGNVTVGDSSADTLTINSTITSNLIFTDNTYDIGASGATRPRNLFLSGSGNVVGTLFKPQDSFIQWNSTGLAGGTNRAIVWADSSNNLYLGSGSGNSTVATFNSTGQSLTGALTTSGNATINGGNVYVGGTGGRGVNLIGGGTGNVQIGGDGSTYAIGVALYNNYASLTTPTTGLWMYGSGGVYQYMSLGGSAYNSSALYIDSSKKVGVSRLPNSWFDVYNSTTMNSASSTGLGYTSSITQGTGTLAMAAGSGNQRGNLMTIYGAMGSPTTTLPYGQDYQTLGLTVAMDVAAGGAYGVHGVSSYVRTDGQGYGFTATVVNTDSTAGRINYGFASNSVSGANINYGFYQNGSSNYNWFNGWVGVGSNALPYGNTTFERMTIEGNTNTRSWLSIRNVNAGSSAYSGVVVNAYGNSWALEMGSAAANSNALNITRDVYGTPAVVATMSTGGLMTFYGNNTNRPVVIGDGGSITIQGESGGWQIGTFFKGSTGTIVSGFGTIGSSAANSYSFVGPVYNNTFAQFTENGIGLANTLPANSGTGITFPATQSASSGANTLDDYEEGTWTPSLYTTGAGTFTYSAQTGGTYVKIGRLMYLSGVIGVATKSGGSAGDSLGFAIPVPAGGGDVSGSGIGYNISAATSGNLTVPSGYSGFPQGGVCTPNTASFYPFWTDGINNRILQYGDIANGFYTQFSILIYTNT